MTLSRTERLKQFISLTTGETDHEPILESLKSVEPAGLEGMAPQAGIRAIRELDKIGAAASRMGQGLDLAPDDIGALEAIIAPNLRPVYDIINDSFDTTVADGPQTPGHALWTKLTTDAQLKARITTAFPAIGRIELMFPTSAPYGGTGFVVGPDLLMTNRHVAQIFAEGLGDRRIGFINGRGAGVDFKRDAAEGHVFKVRRVRMIHPYWDMAILEVDGLPADLQPLRLGLDDARDMLRREIVVVGYPAFDTRNPADVQSDLLRSRFQVKRLQPGLLQGGFQTESFGKIVPAASHDCSTLGGNSGSALLDLQTGQIVGLHFAGKYLERNYAVPTAALAADQRVVNLGLNFAGKASGSNDWGAWWDKADGGTAPETTIATAVATGGSGNGGVPPTLQAAAPAQFPPPGTGVLGPDGTVTFEVPLRITVSLGSQTFQTAAVESVALEAVKPTPPGGAVVPKDPSDYAGRTGYDANFLSGGTELTGVSVPMPDADPKLLAPLKAGGTRLDYQNFSIKMHVNRRLALVTASNVTKESQLRQPEPGRDYSRTGLFSERWFRDQRMDDKYQIPEVFYDDDQGAFDKGHIVRRDDVAWGRTFSLLLQGNVDSFHITNCSPQVEGYNRSDSGERNWGDLENHVLSEAASERLCVFAGPVLAESDQTFPGKGPKGQSLRARVPRRFWKVIVARVSDGLAAFGFILDQDLSNVALEFTVASEFVPAMHRLSEITDLTGVTFDPSLLEADQYGTVRGDEIALRAGAPRV